MQEESSHWGGKKGGTGGTPGAGGKDREVFAPGTLGVRPKGGRSKDSTERLEREGTQAGRGDL